MDESKFDAMPEEERNAFMDACFVYDEELKKKGHVIGGEALENSNTAKTLRYRKGKISATDGPYAETKEQLGGLMILEAGDMNQAVELMSKHPSLPYGSIFEVRPGADLSGLEKESQQRRLAKKEG
jgi:hypothetical protein